MSLSVVPDCKRGDRLHCNCIRLALLVQFVGGREVFIYFSWYVAVLNTVEPHCSWVI